MQGLCFLRLEVLGSGRGGMGRPPAGGYLSILVDVLNRLGAGACTPTWPAVASPHRFPRQGMNDENPPWSTARVVRAGGWLLSSRQGGGPSDEPRRRHRGHGRAGAPSKQNVSLSPLFKVYTFENSGLKFVQINSLRDEVITVIVVTPGAESRLPIGSAAGQPLLLVDEESASLQSG
jgi:hypothetical protein